jgi:hypothetical protein
MSLLSIGRLVAAVLSVVTVAFLFLHDSLRSDNIFLVPDLVVCALLLVAAAWPGRLAATALMVSLAMTAGVLLTSVSSYLVDGELGLPSLIGAATATVMAVALGRGTAQGAGTGSGAPTGATVAAEPRATR